ncbi:MAG TPA: sigma-70 family RNA polymerase sigma factor [Steroidobacteraceae bacterium]|nr:sigma-70 family RNA polymerase sigma factor [Steroidobacteraceae bacterium]
MPRVSASIGDSQESLLLQRIARRDRQALEELYHAYHRRLSRFLLRLAPRYDFAEEVINETFWVIWRKAGEFRGASRVSTWIMGIAYRRALRALRSARQASAADSRAREQGDDQHDDVDALATQDWIARAMRELPEEQRLTLELAYFMGHSCEEIAAITGSPVGTVKARMFHAREKLRRTLPALGGAP